VALAARAPERPAIPQLRTEIAKSNPRSPYERIAASYHEKILTGAIEDGALLPSIEEIAAEFGVSVGTGHRAIELLKKWTSAEVSSGRRTIARVPEDS
jgi:DNA-binding GntR family transcriptional regulator